MNKDFFIYEKHDSLSDCICDDVIELMDNADNITIESEKLNSYLKRELNKNIDEYIKTKLSYLNDEKSNKTKKKCIVPKEIISKVTLQSNKKIPKNIIQCYSSNYLPREINENVNHILKNNPDYNYIFITDYEGKELIKNHFDSNALIAFNKLNTDLAKMNFISFIGLYVYGGIFVNLFSSIKTILTECIPNDVEFVFFYDSHCNINFINNYIMSCPNNNIIKSIINEMVIRINNLENNIELATGKTLIMDIFYKEINNVYIYNFHKNISFNKKYEFLEHLKNNSNCLNGSIVNIKHSKFDFKFDINCCKQFLYNNSNIFEKKNICNIDKFIAYKYSINSNQNVVIDYKNQKPLFFMWFLNDYDGEFVFPNSYKIKPEKFKLIIIPNTWYFNYDEFIKKEQCKYVIHGFLNIDC